MASNKQVASSAPQMSSIKKTTSIERNDRDIPVFEPPAWSMSDIRNAIPSHLFIRYTSKGMFYLSRDILIAAGLFCGHISIHAYVKQRMDKDVEHIHTLRAITIMSWSLYWVLQGFVFTGLWVIGHECGHGAFSPSKRICDTIGFITHSLLLTPYFSWRISHHKHHMNHASIENDQPYVPKTRVDLGIPEHHSELNYEEYFADTPLYTLFMLVRQQLLAFPAYLLYNVSGQKRYPKWTNHFNYNSVLFTREQRNEVLLSDLGIAAQLYLIYCAVNHWGMATVIRYYFIPWLFVTHWFIMITYLQRTDPSLPHYRQGMWNFQRGAAATMDRDFLGPVGRFFFHDVAHFHVVHHFFPKIPFYNGEAATKHLRELLGEYYHRSEAPVFKVLWENYNNCQFVDDTGDIVFYRDKQGHARFRAKA